MKGFFKYFFATVLGMIVTTILLGFIFIIIVLGIASTAKDKPVIVKENSVLRIKLRSEIVDRSSNNPLQNFNIMSMKSENNLGLNDILKNIKKAKTDDRIKGIYLDLTSINAGIATIEEIRNALLSFKESGKFILSYSDYYPQTTYYLASVADKIYLNPQGVVELKGLQAELMFFKGALEKLGVEPQIIRHGKFKSAIEPFILDKMSPENREQTITYMKSIWDNMVSAISKSRNISEADLNLYADSMKIENAKSALELKIVDGLKYKDEVMKELAEMSGNEKNPKFITNTNYMKVPDMVNKPGSSGNKIAVIYASGQIDMGDGDDKSIGSDGISREIKRARLDSTVKAIVLRVNSPGGSALASEVIWREAVLAKQVKPFIVSMGDVAASGGYYIACPADVIVANPNTITGSIGVFGVLWNGQKLMNDKLGITFDRVTTNSHSDIGSVFRPMKQSEKDIIQKSVEEIYDVFITHVAEGRKVTKEQVDSIGQGRVWSGINAKQIKLIDEFGGLERAIEIAAEKANLTSYKIKELPKQLEPFEQILKEFSGESTDEALIKHYFGTNYKYFKNLDMLVKINGIQARLPYFIEIN